MKDRSDIVIDAAKPAGEAGIYGCGRALQIDRLQPLR